ncbi:MAG TPA: hypothetical protein P5081_20920 [Phycisphaerae bacterium]|nr:hypothetical protein [Phycisphaerae bacterium]HRW55344.1 hypothetical protein [Phycisphaerae bacterium]
MAIIRRGRNQICRTTQGLCVLAALSLLVAAGAECESPTSVDCENPGAISFPGSASDEERASPAVRSADGVIYAGTLGEAVQSTGKPGFADIALPPNYKWRPFRKVPGTPVEILTEDCHFPSRVANISADGNTVVGYATLDGQSTAFRWTPSEGMLFLTSDTSGIRNSYAKAASLNGAVIVGEAWEKNAFTFKAFRWSASEGITLFKAPWVQNPEGPNTLTSTADNFARAVAVSDDGRAIAIYAGVGEAARAFYWTEETGAVSLDDSTDPSTNSMPTAISGDGLTVIGELRRVAYRPFRWTLSEGLVILDGLHDSPATGQAFAVSYDGSVIVGTTLDGESIVPFIWDATNGMRTILSAMEPEDAAKYQNWTLKAPYAITADGRTVYGAGYNNETGEGGWTARIR